MYAIGHNLETCAWPFGRGCVQPAEMEVDHPPSLGYCIEHGTEVASMLERPASLL